MILILFRRRHQRHPYPIELCGLYTDLDHFYRAEAVENQRGWHLVGQPIILKEIEELRKEILDQAAESREDSMSTGTQQDTAPQPPTVTVWHVVMPEGTVTFLDHDDVKEFVGPNAAASVRNWLVVTSEVTPDEYEALSRMRGATS